MHLYTTPWKCHRTTLWNAKLVHLITWSKLYCLPEKVDGFENSRLSCCIAPWISDMQQFKVLQLTGFSLVMLVGHISRSMSRMSHGAEARPCRVIQEIIGWRFWTMVYLNGFEFWPHYFNWDTVVKYRDFYNLRSLDIIIPLRKNSSRLSEVRKQE